MDLLARLEALLTRSANLPLTDKKVVNEREALGIVQMIRAALPAELKEAHRLRQEAERLHGQAHDEARRIVMEAQDTARQLVDASTIAKAGEQRSQDLLARTERDAQAIREGADAYARQVLADLEDRVIRILEAIRKGRELLKEASKYD